jgi:hypothetical protein
VAGSEPTAAANARLQAARGIEEPKADADTEETLEDGVDVVNDNVSAGKGRVGVCERVQAGDEWFTRQT